MLEILTGNIEMMILIKLAMVVPILAAFALILKYEKNTILYWIWHKGIAGAGMLFAMFATPYYLVDYTSNWIVIGLTSFIVSPAAAIFGIYGLQTLIARILHLPEPDSLSETPDLGTWPKLPDGVSIQTDEDQF
jgi:hypothetical protein